MHAAMHAACNDDNTVIRQSFVESDEILRSAQGPRRHFKRAHAHGNGKDPRAHAFKGRKLPDEIIHVQVYDRTMFA